MYSVSVPRSPFFPPINLSTWAALTLGVRCISPCDPPISEPRTKDCIGFYLDEEVKKKLVYRDIEEFVHYMINNDLENPRMMLLSDFHPEHPMKLDVARGRLAINKKQISRSVGGGDSSPAYILTPRHKQSSFKYGWILVVFNATSVVQITRNGWGQGSMKNLVRNLVRHGFEFRTLAPSFNLNPQRLIKTSPQLVDFEGIPSIPDIKVPRTVDQYFEYVRIREMIMSAPEAQAAYRMGGILWRLAMETTSNFDDVIGHIMHGPCEVGVREGEYFYIEGMRYYDDCVPSKLALGICGVHGENGVSYWPEPKNFNKRRWKEGFYSRGNLMWNHRDEEFFQRRMKDYINLTGNSPQPIAPKAWKKFFSASSKFDVPFEIFSEKFLDASL